MKILFAEKRILHLESSISAIREWLKASAGTSEKLFNSLIVELNSHLKEYNILRAGVEKAKTVTVFDDFMSIKQAELYVEELLLRAEVSKEIGNVFVGRIDSGVISSESVALENYFSNFRRMTDTAKDVSQKIELIKFTADL